MPTGSYLKTLNIDVHSRAISAQQGRRSLCKRVPSTLFFGLAICTTSLLFLWLYTRTGSPFLISSRTSTQGSVDWTGHRTAANIKILKTTTLYSPSNSIYDEVLYHHAAYDERFGYKTVVLRSPIVKGAATQLHWLQYLIIGEMMKPVEQQAEWIVYFDPSTVLSTNHTSTPLHAYLPPMNAAYGTLKELSIIATKPDDTTLSSSPIFLRTSTLTLQILTLALSTLYTSPDLNQNSDQGPRADIAALSLQNVLETDVYKDKVIYQPKQWYFDYRNAAFIQHWGETEVEILLRVKETLEIFRTDDARGWAEVSFETEMGEWWDLVMEARQVLGEAKDRGLTSEQREFGEKVKELKDAVEMRAWDLGGLMKSVEGLKVNLGIGEVVGIKAAFG